MNGNPSADAVRQLAYQLWLDRGCQGGSPEEDWFRAEEILSDDHRELLQESSAEQSTPAATADGGERRQAGENKVDQAVEESFPASDPPAVHVKDEPPVNAQQKWKAAGKATSRGNRRGSSSTLS